MFEEFKWFETFEWLWFQQSLCFQPDVALPLIVQPVNHSNSDVGVRLKGLMSFKFKRFRSLLSWLYVLFLQSVVLVGSRDFHIAKKN